MKTYEVTVQISPWPEGGVLAEAVDLKGCWVVADSIDQAIDDVREAIQLWIKARRDAGWTLPPGLKEVSAPISIRTVLPIAGP
jgi:predicted RNase H-like HicB family nuclease